MSGAAPSSAQMSSGKGANGEFSEIATSSVQCAEYWILVISDDVCEVTGVNGDLLVDSGACVRVAPKDFAKGITLIKLDSDPELYSATGKQLRVYGVRLVPFITASVEGRRVSLTIRFAIRDVRRLLIAVTALPDHGYGASFSRVAAITNRDTGTEGPVRAARERLLLAGSRAAAGEQRYRG